MLLAMGNVFVSLMAALWLVPGASMWSDFVPRNACRSSTTAVPAPSMSGVQTALSRPFSKLSQSRTSALAQREAPVYPKPPTPPASAPVPAAPVTLASAPPSLAGAPPAPPVGVTGLSAEASPEPAAPVGAVTPAVPALPAPALPAALVPPVPVCMPCPLGVLVQAFTSKQNANADRPRDDGTRRMSTSAAGHQTDTRGRTRRLEHYPWSITTVKSGRRALFRARATRAVARPTPR